MAKQSIRYVIVERIAVGHTIERDVSRIRRAAIITASAMKAKGRDVWVDRQTTIVERIEV